jgi:hypothetical protein
MSNVLFINGWGGAITSVSIARMRQLTIAKFGKRIYAPPPVNHTETGLILRYLDKMQDVVILVGLSCGCSTVNLIAKHRPHERIPYAMYCSPSMYCGVGHVPKNVERATQVTSNVFDFFNPGARRLIVPEGGNSVTVIDEIKSGKGHGFSPDSAAAQQRLFAEIERTLKPAPKGKGK